MDRILVIGGGVGGTLVANLIGRKLRHEIAGKQAAVTVIDTLGEHVYQPGFMYIAMGGERAERLRRPEKSLLDARIELVVGEVVQIDETTARVAVSDALGGEQSLSYDYLVLATGSRILPELIPDFETEAHHFYSAEAAARLRGALDAFTGGRVVIGIAGMPYKC